MICSCDLYVEAPLLQLAKLYSGMAQPPPATALPGEGAFLHGSIQRLFTATTSKKAAREMFRKFDKNSDGTLDYREFSLALTQMGLTELSTQQVQSLARAFDSDGDGSIDTSEFIEQLFNRKVSSARAAAGMGRARRWL